MARIAPGRQEDLSAFRDPSGVRNRSLLAIYLLGAEGSGGQGKQAESGGPDCKPGDSQPAAGLPAPAIRWRLRTHTKSYL